MYYIYIYMYYIYIYIYCCLNRCRQTKPRYMRALDADYIRLANMRQEWRCWQNVKTKLKSLIISSSSSLGRASLKRHHKVELGGWKVIVTVGNLL